MARGNFFRYLRISLLLYVLLFVALGAYMDRSRTTSWKHPLLVRVFPIAGDDSEATRQYIETLDTDSLAGLEAFFAREAHRYGVKEERPVFASVGPMLGQTPPPPPAEGNVLRVALWSLSLRWWSWREPDGNGPDPDVRIYVVFHDPQRTTSVPHSLGLQKGLIGVVHAFAARNMAGSNQVVIAHELMHTLGASDKYDPETTLPVYPIGYAQPDQRPWFPQSKAEIMAGRIPLSAEEAVIPESLREVVVGPATALEIRWIKTLEAP